MGSVWFPRWLWLLYRDTDLKDWTDLWDGDLVLGIPFELVIMSILDGSSDVDALLLLMKLSLPVKFCLWLTPFVLDRTCSECSYECKPDNADLTYIEWLESCKKFQIPYITRLHNNPFWNTRTYLFRVLDNIGTLWYLNITRPQTTKTGASMWDFWNYKEQIHFETDEINLSIQKDKSKNIHFIIVETAFLAQNYLTVSFWCIFTKPFGTLLSYFTFHKNF